MMTVLFFIGRIILGAYFVYNAFNHFRHLPAMTGYTASRKVPYPKAAVIAGGVMLALGGLSILLGLYIVLGMWLLVLFLIPTTFVMHAFWKETDPQAKMMELVQFTKNLALIGALLMMSALFALIAAV